MRGISEAPVGIGVRGEQVAEFVMDNGLGDRQKGKEGSAQAQGGQSHDEYGPTSPTSQPQEVVLYGSKEVAREGGISERYDNGREDEATFDVKHL
jgi:hypothetical protein